MVENDDNVKENFFIRMLKKIESTRSDFYKRAVVAILCGSFVVFAIAFGGFLFNSLVVTVAVICAVEFSNMIYTKQSKENLSSDNVDVIFLKRLLFPYILIPVFSIIFIRGCVQGGAIIIWFFLNIWSVDTASYIIGILFGKNKLYPSISPNKTIEGAVGGIVASIIATSILFPIMLVIHGYHYNGFNFYSIVFLSLAISISAIIGDLFESYIKRQCRVKDSGRVLLSHGGMMDRIDSLTFSAPIVAIFAFMKNGVFF